MYKDVSLKQFVRFCKPVQKKDAYRLFDDILDYI